MKTNYLQRNRRRNSSKNKIIFLLIILAVFGVVFYYFSGIITSLIEPAWKGENRAASGIASVSSWTKSKSELYEQNEKLRETVSLQQAKLVSLEIAKAQEEVLLSILGREPNVNAVLSSVLVRPPETPYDTFIIDAGKDDGIQVGKIVYMAEGPVLGKTIEVGQSTSKIKLYSASGEKTNAILERHSIPVVLLGRGAGGFTINFPRDVEVMEGDKILSSDTSPRLIGVVGTVHQDPTDSFKEVLVKGVSNIFKLRYVLIEK